ncbi:hypothetical protein ACOMHN_005964 [Nucella lapillus]
MGKISKPQKSNKHKKLKFVDPFYHGERKERMHAGKNLVPVSTEQGLSRSMKDLMRRTKQAKEMHRKSRKQKKEILKKRILSQQSTEGAKRDFQEVVEFHRKGGEKQSQFLQRVDAATMAVVKESQIEASFKTTPDPMEEVTRQKAEKRKEKLKLKKELKKEKKKEKTEDDFKEFKDEVKFGEVVHGLPSFSARPKHADGSSKPALKSLLLYDVITKSDQSTGPESAHAESVKTAKKGKRKILSPAQQKDMEKERQNAIGLYRQMKKKSSRAS